MGRLTCTEGGSNKFWEGTVDGNTLTVRFGKIGTAGQTKSTDFASAAEAEKELGKLIKQKHAKGYVEATSAAPASAEEAPGENKLAATLNQLDLLWKSKLPAVVTSSDPGSMPPSMRSWPKSSLAKKSRSTSRRGLPGMTDKIQGRPICATTTTMLCIAWIARAKPGPSSVTMPTSLPVRSTPVGCRCSKMVRATTGCTTSAPAHW